MPDMCGCLFPGNIECLVDVRDSTRGGAMVGTEQSSEPVVVLQLPVADISPRQFFGLVPPDAECLSVTVFCEASSNVPDATYILRWEDGDTTGKYEILYSDIIIGLILLHSSAKIIDTELLAGFTFHLTILMSPHLDTHHKRGHRITLPRKLPRQLVSE